MRRFLLAVVGALVLSMAIGTTTEANDRSVRAVMIPATACRALPGSGAQLADFGWVATNGASGDVVCPVPFNNIELGTSSADNDMTSFRIQYMDSDGSGSANALQALFYRYNDGSFAVSYRCSVMLAPAKTSVTSTTVPCVEDVASGGMFYAFLVRLSSAANGRVIFRGIDFP